MVSVTEDWQLVNKKTGEVRDLVAFTDDKKERWEKVYAKNLAELLNIAGDERTQVIAYLIKEKDYKNRVMGTIRSVAKETGVSTATVNRTFQILQENNFLHKIQNGFWRFSPHIMVNGSHATMMATLREWEQEAKVTQFPKTETKREAG
jgi:DNA-binding transcriptional regulator YhcF (GntR family)